MTEKQAERLRKNVTSKRRKTTPTPKRSNPRRNVPRGRKESQELKALCDYIKIKYPRILWRSDMSGIALDKKVAAVYWRDYAKYKHLPDWVCYAHCRDWFIGLQIEIKVTGFDLLGVLDGRCGSAEQINHHRGQLDMIHELRGLGWCAGFGVGKDNCIGLLDAYMDGDLEKINKFIIPKIKPLL